MDLNSLKRGFFGRAVGGTDGDLLSSETEFFLRLIAAGFTVDAAGIIATTVAPAFSGASLTNLNASNLASGTVPLARLSGITNAEIATAAAIAMSKLSLSITNTEVNASAAIALSKLAQASGASILVGRGGSGGAGALQEITLGTGLGMTGTVLAATSTPESDQAILAGQIFQ